MRVVEKLNFILYLWIIAILALVQASNVGLEVGLFLYSIAVFVNVLLGV